MSYNLLMKKIYIIHGWSGASNADWIGWAGDAFKEKGYEVVVPDMPDTDNPQIKPWVDYLSSLVTDINSNTYFIGHSIGCQTIMRFLEKADKQAGGAIFVAAWFNLVNLESKESEDIAEPWIKTPIDLEKVKKNLKQSIVILGDNDKWVPYLETKKDFESKLGSKAVTIKNGGHITSDENFGPFPQLVKVFEENFK